MKNGIVMEIKKNKCIVMTDKGQFHSIKLSNKTIQVGDEISFENKNDSVFFTHSNLRSLLATAIIFLLILSPSLFFNQKTQVYAYFTIEINPSIEISVNEQFEVINIEPLNSDGNKILSSIPTWKNESIEKVTNLIVVEIKKNGFVKNNSQMLIITSTLSESKSVINDIDKKANKIQNLISLKHNLQVENKSIPFSLQQEAKSQKLTTGKYYMLKKAYESGIEIENVTKKSINDISKEINKAKERTKDKSKKDHKIKNEPKRTKQNTSDEKIPNTYKENEPNKVKNRVKDHYKKNNINKIENNNFPVKQKTNVRNQKKIQKTNNKTNNPENKMKNNK